MTSEMIFECLLISRNVDLLRTMNRLLELLSIHTRVCMTSWRALELLPTSHADLVVLDWDQDDTGGELVRKIWSSESRRKPTVVAIVNGTRSIPGAPVLVPNHSRSSQGLNHWELPTPRCCTTIGS